MNIVKTVAIPEHVRRGGFIQPTTTYQVWRKTEGGASVLCDCGSRQQDAEEICSALNTVHFSKLAIRALSFSEEQDHSDEHIDALNAFTYELQQMLPDEAWRRFEVYALKATSEEMIDYGLELLDNWAKVSS